MRIIKNAEIKKDNSTVNVTVGNREISCKGYLITLKKADINQFLESLTVSADSVLEVKDDVGLILTLLKERPELKKTGKPMRSTLIIAV